MALFGVPDMGKVCTEKHMPNFLEHVRHLMLDLGLLLVKISNVFKQYESMVKDDCIFIFGQADELKRRGIDKIACAAVAPYQRLNEWAKRAGNSDGQVR